MLKTILHRLNLYERFNKLVTQEEMKIFRRTVYTLSICTIAIIFIWYCGIMNLSTKNHNSIFPDTFLNKSFQGLGKKTNQKNNDRGGGLLSKESKVSDHTKAANSAVPTGTSLSGSAETTTPAGVTSPVNTSPSGVTSAVNSSPAGVTAAGTTSPAGVTAAGVTSGPALVKENTKNVKKDAAKTNSQNKQSSKEAIPQTIYKGESKPYVALTFDDGYNKKSIIKVLDILKKHNIKSTFFILGRVLDDYPDVWKRAIDEGHQICNHTMNHSNLTKLTDQQVKNEILAWEASVKKYLGEEYLNRMKSDFRYLRLPGGGGNKSDRILAIANENGYKVIGWNLETTSIIINPMRKQNASVSEIANKIEKHVVNKSSKGSIILLHFNEYDVYKLDEIITGIKKRGFGFQTVTDIMKKNQ